MNNMDYGLMLEKVHQKCSTRKNRCSISRFLLGLHRIKLVKKIDLANHVIGTWSNTKLHGGSDCVVTKL